MSLQTIERPASLVEEVCRQISGQIHDDAFTKDGWLPAERELAERLGVSRPVVREATKRLELQGLLEIRHGVGIKVVDKLHKPLNGSVALLIPDTADRLRQLTEARLLIEPGLARMAAERVTNAHLRSLRQNQVRLAAAETYEQSIEADLEFHRLIALAAGNEICTLLLDSLAELGRESRKTTLSAVGNAVAVAHHSQILAAIEARQPERASAAMKMHLEAAAVDIAKGLKLRGKGKAAA
jgi:GntR family transcriptional regulator, transcriptional repressor for pyruvate dehydrogenase complex